MNPALLEAPSHGSIAVNGVRKTGVDSNIRFVFQEPQDLTKKALNHDVGEAVKLADRVIIIDEHKVRQDIKIQLPRPRVTGNDSSYYEKLILSNIMNEDETSKDYSI
nr:hypothetical protein [uncultured Clostridium sp.]